VEERPLSKDNNNSKAVQQAGGITKAQEKTGALAAAHLEIPTQAAVDFGI
jgi:hypothetical protein